MRLLQLLQRCKASCARRVTARRPIWVLSGELGAVVRSWPVSTLRGIVILVQRYDQRPTQCLWALVIIVCLIDLKLVGRYRCSHFFFIFLFFGRFHLQFASDPFSTQVEGVDAVAHQFLAASEENGASGAVAEAVLDEQFVKRIF